MRPEDLVVRTCWDKIRRSIPKGRLTAVEVKTIASGSSRVDVVGDSWVKGDCRQMSDTWRTATVSVPTHPDSMGDVHVWVDEVYASLIYLSMMLIPPSPPPKGWRRLRTRPV